MEQLASLKKILLNFKDIADCSFSNKWSKCEAFFEYPNNRKVFAFPRNFDDIFSKTWENAAEICNKNNASLVAIESQEKQRMFHKFLGHFGHSTSWTGHYGMF